MSDDPPLTERDPISDKVFIELLKLYKHMVSGTGQVKVSLGPVDDLENRLIIAQFLDAEAAKRGYEHWGRAYNDLIAGDADE